jgi:predicted small metal-binding protein
MAIVLEHVKTVHKIETASQSLANFLRHKLRRF